MIRIKIYQHSKVLYYTSLESGSRTQEISITCNTFPINDSKLSKEFEIRVNTIYCSYDKSPQSIQIVHLNPLTTMCFNSLCMFVMILQEMASKYAEKNADYFTQGNLLK